MKCASMLVPSSPGSQASTHSTAKHRTAFVLSLEHPVLSRAPPLVTCLSAADSVGH